MTDIAKQYEDGLQGFVEDKAEDWRFEEYLRQTPGQYHGAHEVVDVFSLKDRGKGKLALPYLAAVEMYPGCLPGGRQMRGSCVAWSTRNALMVSYCAYLKYGPNDLKHAAPTLTRKAMNNGAFATEGIYWFRRHGRDGWQCSAAAKVATTECGLLSRQAYPDLGLDLTEYSPKTEGKWGASLPPEEVRDVCNDHISGSSTVCKSWAETRDMIASGYAISSCGSEAWEMGRDENGVARRSKKSWAHAMAGIAVDDRPETHDKYGCGLILVQNSWGNVNKGSDKIRGTDKVIPPGSFWSRWDDFDNRYVVALGPAKGWPAMVLPDFGTGGIL